MVDLILFSNSPILSAKPVNIDPSLFLDAVFDTGLLDWIQKFCDLLCLCSRTLTLSQWTDTFVKVSKYQSDCQNNSSVVDDSSSNLSFRSKKFFNFSLFKHKIVKGPFSILQTPSIFSNWSVHDSWCLNLQDLFILFPNAKNYLKHYTSNII